MCGDDPLAHSLVDELTSRLTGPAASRPTGSPANNIRHLPVRLDCVIAALQMPLAQVLALKPGDILMVRLLERCEVQINQQKLAAIVTHLVRRGVLTLEPPSTHKAPLPAQLGLAPA